MAPFSFAASAGRTPLDLSPPMGDATDTHNLYLVRLYLVRAIDSLNQLPDDSVMVNPFIWILEKILGPRMSVEERIAHNKRLAGIVDPDGPPVTQQELDDLKDRILSMQAPIIACRPQDGQTSTRPDESRLGGWPGWPESEDLPTGSDGRPMLFLCQINFAEMPAFDPFPTKGLMQIFVARDEMYGCQFPSRDRDGFRVIYRADSDDLAIVDPLQGIPASEFSVLDEDLHQVGRPIVFTIEDMVPPTAHYLIAAEFADMWQRDGSADFDQIDEFCGQRGGPEMYLGGYPRFVQYDIRAPNQMADFDQVVMQFGAPKGMMWGDLGEACFLMRREDLLDKAFEKAIYNWDCS